MPKVSVALPVYNGERHLAAAIESLLLQTFSDFELILVDNASTDGTADICRRFAERDRRVRYHRNSENIGAAPNFNLAFGLAQAEYFKWAAHDDVCEPDYLRECVAVLDADPGVVLCHTDTVMIDEEGKFLCGYDPDLNQIGAARPSERFRNLILSEHWCFDVFGVIRREELARTPLIARYIGSDRNLLAELGLLGRFHRVPRPLFQSRDHRQRSVRAIDIRARAGWFDPTLSGRIVLPFWRSLAEYAAAVHRTPLEQSERLACYMALVTWLGPNRWRLRTDLRTALMEGAARALGRRPQA